jgi:hypothetical protein
VLKTLLLLIVVIVTSFALNVIVVMVYPLSYEILRRPKDTVGISNSIHKIQVSMN